MRLGVFTAILSHLPLQQALDELAALGAEAVELGTGNYPGSAHCDPDELLADAAALRCFRGAVESRGLVVSALSQHGNPLHPDDALARAHHETWRKTVRLAAALEIRDVVAFSGCPGDAPDATAPNWVTIWWPEDYERVLRWQWEERVLPYWTREAAYAREHGVRIAFEPHPGFVVYNPETLLRLRAAIGENAGANFDPSHLFWQGIDPVEAVRALAAADAIFHVHAKDTRLDAENVRINGVLDPKPFAAVADRAWSFRTVGDGHDEETWRAILQALREAGYDGAVSIEHEDPLLPAVEGLERAIRFLKPLLLD